MIQTKSSSSEKLPRSQSSKFVHLSQLLFLLTLSEKPVKFIVKCLRSNISLIWALTPVNGGTCVKVWNLQGR